MKTNFIEWKDRAEVIRRLVKSAPTFRCETPTTTMKQSSKLIDMEMRLFKMVKGKTMRYNIRNEDFRASRWFGHI